MQRVIGRSRLRPGLRTSLEGGKREALLGSLCGFLCAAVAVGLCVLALGGVARGQTFQKNADRADRQFFPRDQLQLDDGGFLVCGDAYITGTQTSRPYLQRLDVFGRVQWTQEYRLQDTFHQAQAIVPAGPDRFDLLIDVYGTLRGAVLSVDGSGAVLGARGYFVGGAELELEDMIVTSDGGRLIVGVINRVLTGRDAIAIKLDATGAVSWAREFAGSIAFPAFGSDDNASSAVEAADGSGYYVLGLIESNAMLVRFDLTGAIVSQRSYKLLGGFVFERSLAFLETGGAVDYLVCNANFANDLFPLIMQLDDQGDLVSGLAGSFPISTTRAIGTSDGGFALAGASLITPGAQGLRLAKYDAGANFEWSFQYDVMLTFATINPPANLIQTSDDGYLVSVAALAGFEPVQHLVRADAAGELGCGQTAIPGPFVFDVEAAALNVALGTPTVSAPVVTFDAFPLAVDVDPLCEVAACGDGTADPFLTDLGFALAGTHGEPALGAAGCLTANTPFYLHLSNALENTTAFLVVGVARIDAPFKGGVLVPDVAPPGLVLGLPTGPSGGFLLDQTWPNLGAGGFSLYLQTWIQDPAGPAGFAATNALEGTVP